MFSDRKSRTLGAITEQMLNTRHSVGHMPGSNDEKLDRSGQTRRGHAFGRKKF